jgi:chemotaxis signal transduction protein
VPCPESRIFIMEDGGEFIGLLVDRVDEVIETNPAGLQTPPANISAGHARFVRGICRTTSRVMTVLDTSTVLSERA